MSKRIYYHGTSIANLPNILKNGIQPVSSNQRIWSDSYSNLVYLWDDEKTEGNGLYYAKLSGAYSTAVLGKEQRIVVFKIEMPYKYVDPDSSGIGMEEQGAVQTQCVPKRYIKEYYISENIAIFTSFILLSVVSTPNHNLRYFSKVGAGWAKRIDADVYWLDELDFMNWDTVILKPQRHGQSIGDTAKNAIRS